MEELNALGIALTSIGTVLTGFGVWTGKRQIDTQQALAREAAQPYVWADVQADPYQGWTLDLVIQNNGPTVATNIMVKFDPRLPSQGLKGEGRDLTNQALDRLEAGIQSLPPNKPLRWHLGSGPELLKSAESQRYTVTVTADGPFGPVTPLTYVIDLSDFRESQDNPDGSIHLLTEAVAKGIDGIKKEMQRKRD